MTTSRLVVIPSLLWCALALPACAGDDSGSEADADAGETGETGADAGGTDDTTDGGSTDDAGTEETGDTGETTGDTGETTEDTGETEGGLTMDCEMFFAVAAGNYTGTANLMLPTAGDIGMWFEQDVDYPIVIAGSTITIEGSMKGDVVFDFADPTINLGQCTHSSGVWSIVFNGNGNTTNLGYGESLGTFTTFLIGVNDGTSSGFAGFNVTPD